MFRNVENEEKLAKQLSLVTSVQSAWSDSTQTVQLGRIGRSKRGFKLFNSWKALSEAVDSTSNITYHKLSQN